MWGQPYGSPLEAWLAAPFVAALGTTTGALRLLYFLLGLGLIPVAYGLGARARSARGAAGGDARGLPAAVLPAALGAAAADVSRRRCCLRRALLILAVRSGGARLAAGVPVGTPRRVGRPGRARALDAPDDRRRWCGGVSRWLWPRAAGRRVRPGGGARALSRSARALVDARAGRRAGRPCGQPLRPRADDGGAPGGGPAAPPRPRGRAARHPRPRSSRTIREHVVLRAALGGRGPRARLWRGRSCARRAASGGSAGRPPPPGRGGAGARSPFRFPLRSSPPRSAS